MLESEAVVKILHICAGWQKWNGAANIARMIMDEQRREGHEVSFATWAKVCDLRTADEVWIHCGWLPCLWWAALWAKNARWMPEACYDPVRLKFSAWKKRLVGPIERWALRRCKKIMATCEAEKGWIRAYLGKRCPEIEVEDIKRFFKLNHEIHEKGKLHLLYLGRRHPLKGVEFLERAVEELNYKLQTPNYELKIVSNAFGEEKEKIWKWCNVLALPTLSENFGLVVAEALERGKRVITTDGAPAWDSGELRVESGECLAAKDAKGAKRDVGRIDRVEGGVFSDYGGRVLYLKGYRDGTREIRVELLKKGIEIFARQGE